MHFRYLRKETSSIPYDVLSLLFYSVTFVSCLFMYACIINKFFMIIMTINMLYLTYLRKYTYWHSLRLMPSLTKVKHIEPQLQFSKPGIDFTMAPTKLRQMEKAISSNHITQKSYTLVPEMTIQCRP